MVFMTVHFFGCLTTAFCISFLGIFFTEGQVWFEQRRFALRFMRDFGFGRRQDELESEIQDEILVLMDLLKNGPKYEFEKVLLVIKFPAVIRTI